MKTTGDAVTDEEWLEVFDLLWRMCWIYAGTQNDRRELLEIKARIDARDSPFGTPDVGSVK